MNQMALGGGFQPGPNEYGKLAET